MAKLFGQLHCAVLSETNKKHSMGRGLVIKKLPGPSRVGSVPRAGRLCYLAVPDALTLSVAAAAANLLRGYIRSTAQG